MKYEELLALWRQYIQESDAIPDDLIVDLRKWSEECKNGN